MICRMGHTSSTSRELSPIPNYYIFLARAGASLRSEGIDSNARWFGPFATMTQAQMIRTSAFSLGLVANETEAASSRKKHVGDTRKPQWHNLANT